MNKLVHWVKLLSSTIEVSLIYLLIYDLTATGSVSSVCVLTL